MSTEKTSIVDKVLNASSNFDNIMDNLERFAKRFGPKDPDNIQRQVASALKDNDPMDKEIMQIDYEIEKWSSIYDKIRNSRNVFSYLYRNHAEKVAAENRVLNEIRRLQTRKQGLERRNQEAIYRAAESETRNKVNEARKNKSDADLHVEKNRSEINKLRAPAAPPTWPRRNNDLINHLNNNIDKLQDRIDKLMNENVNFAGRKTIDTAITTQIAANRAIITDLQNRIDNMNASIQAQLALPV